MTNQPVITNKLVLMNKHEIASELSTLRDLIRWGTSQFNAAELSFTQGMPNALDEAVYLCLNALHLPVDFSADYFACTLTMDERLAVLALYQQRIEKRLPAAYITHEAWFCGLSFYVDERVLIPRSPLAELIQQQFEPWVAPAQVHYILDLCTGSACIAVACAYAFADAEVVGSDISTDALAVARTNQQNHGLETQLQLVESDLFTNVPARRYDIIVSNPPYVSQQEMQTLATEFDHEPELALQAGDDGMDLVIPILQQARGFLSDHGVLVVEVGYSRSALEKLFPQVPFCWLDFEQGGEGVFLLTVEQIEACQKWFDEVFTACRRKINTGS